MNIVFLDYDGVLNTPIVNGYPTTMYYPSDNKVNNSEAVKFIQLLCETCKCDIVVISSWRCEDNYADCIYNSGLSKIIKIVDFMPKELSKSEIVNTYLQTHTVENYIIIEDQYISGVPRSRFIKCNYDTGFDKEKLKLSIKKFKGEDVYEKNR